MVVRMRRVLSQLLILAVALSAVAAAADTPVPPPRESESSSPFALVSARMRGARSAERDIRREVLRILDYGEPLPPGTGRRKDGVTGYPLESITGCAVTNRFVAEVDAYNKAMRDWHAKHSPRQHKPSNKTMQPTASPRTASFSDD
jgi:hypothetical protein